MKEIDCPSCTEGKLLAVPPARMGVDGKIRPIPPIDCPDCNATGKVEIEEEWIKKGKVLSDKRKIAHTTLRSFCMENNLDPVKISRIERGLEEPDEQIVPLYNDLLTKNGDMR